MDVRTLNLGDVVAVFRPLRRGNISSFGACKVTKKNKVRIVLTRETDGHEFAFSAKHGDLMYSGGHRCYETSVMPVESAERHEAEMEKKRERFAMFRSLEAAASSNDLEACKEIMAKLEVL